MTNSEPTAAISSGTSSLREAMRERYAPRVMETLVHRQKEDAWVSVIVAGTRSAERTITCLDRLRQQNRVPFERCEIIVAEVGDLESVRELLPLRADIELRMARGCSVPELLNAAVALSSAPLLAFVDSSAVVATDYLPKALSHFDDHAVLAIRSRVLPNKHGLLAAVAFDHDAGPEPFEDPVVSVHSSLIRSEAFIAADGFTNLPAPLAAVDLGMRLTERYPSHRLLYTPDLIMHRDRCESWQELLLQSHEHAGLSPNHVQLTELLEAAVKRADANRSLSNRAAHLALFRISQGVSYARHFIDKRFRKKSK